MNITDVDNIVIVDWNSNCKCYDLDDIVIIGLNSNHKISRSHHNSKRGMNTFMHMNKSRNPPTSNRNIAREPRPDIIDKNIVRDQLRKSKSKAREQLREMKQKTNAQTFIP